MHYPSRNKDTSKKKKKIAIIAVIGVIIIGLIFSVYKAFNAIKNTDTLTIAKESLSVVNSVIKILPIEEDTKKEIDVTDQLLAELTKKDDVKRRYLVLLQNNHELRPGGGFLGQYAVLTVQNGELLSYVVEDANLLDQRIVAKVSPPSPFRTMLQLKNWKFRDSNFSPDFPTNAEKAKYFFRLSGGNSNFDGVFGVNAEVFSHFLKITGPITVPGHAETYTSDNAILLLEEKVERAYLGDNVAAESKQHRKDVMKQIAKIMIDKLISLNNIPKIAETIQEEMRNRNVTLYFKDEKLQNLVKSVHWDGSVAGEWDGDYLMVVDSNMGSLKTDYYMKRAMNYEVDFTGEKAVATLTVDYHNTAKQGDWRTSDYHTYTRTYTPRGSVFIERKLIGYPVPLEEFGKTYFGYKVDVVMNTHTQAVLKYQLPENIKPGDYKLLVQKQSGVGDVPIHVLIKTPEKTLEYETILKKDLKLHIAEVKELQEENK